MKLDLYEINRLSPPGLWDLGVLVALIAMLRGVISAGKSNGAGGMSALLYGQMVLRYSESLRAKTRDNLNMRIKAWVLQCPARIAHVRSVIGSAAIRRWRTNRLLDYALTRYFGDWKRKFPDGFNKGGFANETTDLRRQSTPNRTSPRTGEIRPYTWQPFALVKTLNVQGFLYRKFIPEAQKQDMRNVRDAYLKLWGVDIADTPALRKWTQPRQPRTMPPIRFTPTELARELNMDVEPETAPEAETSPVIDAQEVPKRIAGKVELTGENSDVPPSDEKPP